MRAILWMAARRLVRNWGLTTAMLVGLVTAVSLCTAIIVYADGALQRLLEDRWSLSRKPGVILLRHQGSSQEPTTPDQYRRLTGFLQDQVPVQVRLPLTYVSRAGALHMSRLIPPEGQDPTVARYGQVTFVSNLAEHIEMLDGRMPSDQPAPGGVIEVMVDEWALYKHDLVVGQVYRYPLQQTAGARAVPIRIVGVFRGLDRNAPYWYRKPPFEDQLFVTEKAFFDQLLADPAEVAVDSYNWWFAFDHRRLRFTDVDRLAGALGDLLARARQLMPYLSMDQSPMEVLGAFQSTGFYLRLLLLILALPVLGITLYYTALVAGLVLDRQRGEIAVLRSRGASAIQVILASFLQWVLAGAAALPAGALLGIGLARVLGAAAGFLTFSDRDPLPLIFTERFYTYALLGLAVGLVAALIPALTAARESIISHKLELARSVRRPLWQRLFLDAALVGGALYGHRLMARQTLALDRDSPLLYDPTLFAFPVLLVVGGALLTVRLLPYLFRVLAWLAERGRGAAAWLAVVQMSRGAHQYTPQVLLLVLTVGLGIFSAAPARTLDQNFSDQVAYDVGADLVLEENWRPDPNAGGPGGPSPPRAELPPLQEPPWEVHLELPGVQAATRVYVEKARASVGGKSLGMVRVFGIEPHSLTRVAFFRRDLERYHINQYMRLLARMPDGALASSRLMEKMRLRPGDRITVTPQSSPPIEMRIAAGIHYWSTVDPGQEPFVVGNLSHFTAELGLAPYQVWLDMDDVTPASAVVEALRQKGITLIQYRDARARAARERRDPQRTGLLGVLSLGYLASGALTAAGFLIATLLSLQRRTVQFGILRATGLSVGQLGLVLGMEQVLTTAVGVAAGGILGEVSVRLFVPFLQGAADRYGGVPPFRLVLLPEDLLRMYAILGTVLVLTLLVIGIAVVRMKLHETIKLGEEN